LYLLCKRGIIKSAYPCVTGHLFFSVFVFLSLTNNSLFVLYTFGNLDFTETTGTVCKAVKFLDTTPETTTFENGQIITQTRLDNGVTYEAQGRVIHWDAINKVLRYYQNEYISAAQSSGSKNKLIAFAGNSPITSSTGSATPDSSFTGSIAGLPAIQFLNEGWEDLLVKIIIVSCSIKLRNELGRSIGLEVGQ